MLILLSAVTLLSLLTRSNGIITAALIDALRTGRIAHAALDVFDEEPMTPGHPFTELERVTLSAHSAFRTPEASDTLIRRALDIAKSLASG